MASTTDPQRLHALDALRATAMLLGIVLHIAWFYMPVVMGAPLVDRSATPFLGYVFFAIHVFRMQAFFLIAGFFAHLLESHRGPRKFVRDRLVRIGVPFVVGWLICWPIMTYWSLVAGVQSGGIITDTPPWMITLAALVIPSVMWPLLNQTHLWFLYTLLWLYALMLVAHLAMVHAFDPSNRLRLRLHSVFARGLEQDWALPLLVALTAIGMYQCDWAGIAPGISLLPNPVSLGLYGLFFVVGWLMYGPVDLWPAFDHGWRWRLAAGLTLTVPLFLFYYTSRRDGRLTMLEAYPNVVADEIRDWPSFRSRLLAERDQPTRSIARNLWDLLDGATQRFVESHPEIDTNQKSGFGMQLDALVLPSTEFLKGLDPFCLNLPPEGRKLAARPAETRTQPETLLLNRLALEAQFPGVFAPSNLDNPRMRWIRPAYALVYATATWLLVFGLIGLFRRQCDQPSPRWRYMADASYWFYLAHLPIIFWIQTLLGPLAWPWWLKAPLVLLLTVGLLFPSYHWLVRPTVLGHILNGRRHPIHMRHAPHAPIHHPHEGGF